MENQSSTSSPKGCIGYKKDFTEAELAGKHIDSVTGLVFNTIEDYEEFVSPAEEEEIEEAEVEEVEETTEE